MSEANHRRGVPYAYIIRLSAIAAGGSISITRRSAPAADQNSLTGNSAPAADQNSLTRNSAPAAGSTYIIVEKSTGQALTFSHGKLTLATVPELSFDPHTLDPVQAVTFAFPCNWHWHCKESEGWLVFRNAVTGGWLGQEAMWPVLMPAGRFCVKKEKCGDNYLLTKKFMVEGKAVMESIEFEGYAPDGRRLVNREIGGSDTGETTWEFVEVTVAPKDELNS